MMVRETPQGFGGPVRAASLASQISSMRRRCGDSDASHSRFASAIGSEGFAPEPPGAHRGSTGLPREAAAASIEQALVHIGIVAILAADQAVVVRSVARFEQIRPWGVPSRFPAGIPWYSFSLRVWRPCQHNIVRLPDRF
jgi:hypothetical protein